MTPCRLKVEQLQVIWTNDIAIATQVTWADIKSEIQTRPLIQNVQDASRARTRPNKYATWPIDEDIKADYCLLAFNLFDLDSSLRPRWTGLLQPTRNHALDAAQQDEDITQQKPSQDVHCWGILLSISPSPQRPTPWRSWAGASTRSGAHSTSEGHG